MTFKRHEKVAAVVNEIAKERERAIKDRQIINSLREEALEEFNDLISEVIGGLYSIPTCEEYIREIIEECIKKGFYAAIKFEIENREESNE